MIEYFKIADLFIAVGIPDECNTQDILPSFIPFLIEDKGSQSIFMQINISTEEYTLREETKILKDLSYILEYQFRLEESTNFYITTIIESGNQTIARMRSTKDFRTNKIFTNSEYLIDPFRIKWMIMIAFGQCVLQEKGVLIHASAVLSNKRGYAFLGVSGTGKSTHSNLWINNIKGTELLNDDNPILRIKDDGSVWIYGSPWSGKTDCYKSEKAILGSIIRLEQAPYNEFISLEKKKALFALLPSGSALPWNDSLFQLMVDHLSYIAEHVKVCQLKCLPNRQAAELCYSMIVD